MGILKWMAGAVVTVLVLLFIGFQIFKPQVAERLYQRAVAQNVTTSVFDTLPEGLHVFMCGTGSPFSDPERAGPCLGVLAGRRAFLFDAGSGSIRTLGRMGFPLGQIERTYLTHLHSDHIDGLGELLVQTWVGGNRAEPLPIVGPVGTSEVVEGFNIAYRIDSTYRVAHHGPEIANPDGFGFVAEEIVVPAGPDGSLTVLDEGDLKITAIRVEHSPVEPAFGFRVDYGDRSVSFSGDTIYAPAFVALSDEVDVMFHEALDPEMVSGLGEGLASVGRDNAATIMSDILDYHATPEDAARAASAAEAGELVYYHIVPPLPAQLLHSMFLGDSRDEFDGKITIGEDGMIVSLPSGSDEINHISTF